jgi:hypothetical protein
VRGGGQDSWLQTEPHLERWVVGRLDVGSFSKRCFSFFLLALRHHEGVLFLFLLVRRRRRQRRRR